MYRRLLIGLLLLPLAACSGVKFAYHQLDWFVPRYVERYVELDDAQSELLKVQTAELLKWHCGTQLTSYAASLREMNADFQNGPVSRTRLATHQVEMFRYWQALAEQAAPSIVTLLATATDEQRAELFANFERANDKFQAEYVDRPEAARRKAATKAMRERLEDWIGELTIAQRQAVATWSETLELSGSERLQFRRHWQAELRHALDRRDDRVRFAATVQDLLTRPERYWSVDYTQKNARAREQALALIAEIGATLEPAQRQHLATRVNRWAGDFEQLACAPPQIRTTSAVGAPAVVR